MLPRSSESSAERGPGRSRGMVGSTQLALLMPLLLTVIFAVIQASIWFAGRSTAQQAAMAGAERAAFASALADDAERVAHEGQEQQHRGEHRDLDGIHVGVDRQTQLVQVRVTGQVPGLLPGPWTVVDASAQRVKEA